MMIVSVFFVKRPPIMGGGVRHHRDQANDFAEPAQPASFKAVLSAALTGKI